MATDVSIRVGVDGEAEFRSALSGINSQIKNLNAEMKTIVTSMNGMDNAEEKVAQQINVLGRAMDATKQKISTLSAEYDRQKSALDKLSAALDEAESAEYNTFAERDAAISKATNAYNRQQTVVNKLGTQLNNATSDMNRMEQEMNDLKNGADQASDALDDAGKSALTFGDALKANVLGDMITSGLRALGNGLKSAFSTGLSYNSTLETYTTSFEVMSGSAEKATETVERLADIAATTPFEMPDLANVTQLLMNYGFTADEAIDRMTMLGDISQGNAEKMQSIATAYGQMSSAGKVQLEDIKQMIENGFNPLQEISKTTGESMESLYERISDGAVSVDEITASMQRATSEGGQYFQSMEKQSQTFDGQLSTLKDNINSALGDTFQSVSTTLTEEVFPALNDAIGSIDFAAIGENIGNALSFILENGDTIAAVVAAIGAAFLTWNITSILASMGGLLPAIATGISAVTTALAANPFGLIATAIVGVVTALTVLWNTNEGFRTAVIEIWESIKTAFAEAWVAIQGAWASAVQFFQDIWAGIQSAFSTAYEFLSNAFNSAWSAIQSAWSNVVGFFQGIWSGIQSAFSSVQSFFSNAFSAAWNAVQSVWSTVTGFFQGVWSGIQSAFSGVQSFFSNAFNSAKNAVQSAWSGITGFFSGKWAEIKGVFSDVWSFFSNIGSNIVNGIKSGISNAWNSLTGFISDKVSGLVNSAKSKLGIASPSRVFRDQIGLMIVRGLAVGIEKGMPLAVNAMDNVNDKIIKTSRSLGKALEKEQTKLNEQLAELDQKERDRQAAEELADYKEKIQKKYDELAEAEISERQKIQDEISRMEEEWRDEQLREQLEAQIDALEEFTDAYEDALSEIEDAQESMSDKLKDYGELFETVKTETSEYLELGDLEDDIAIIERYGDALEQLKERGISDTLMSEILGMDVDDAIAYTEKLLGMTDDQYDNYMSLWQQKQEAAQKIAKQFYQDEMDALQEEFVDKIPSELGYVKDEMRDIGVDGIQGMIDGMYSRSGALWSAASSIVSQAIAAMQAAAEIHSPSKKTRDLVGKPMGEGVAVGMLEALSASRSVIDNAIMQPLNRISRDDMYNAAAATVNGMAATGTATGTQTIIIPVNLNGKQIAEVVFDPLKQIGKQRGVALG